jgi:hypothetical protein
MCQIEWLTPTMAATRACAETFVCDVCAVFGDACFTSDGVAATDPSQTVYCAKCLGRDRMMDEDDGCVGCGSVRDVIDGICAKCDERYCHSEHPTGPNES